MKKSASDLRSSAVDSVQAVALDAYGTLIDFTEPDFIVMMAEVCARQGLEADAAEMWRRFLRASYVMRAEHHHDPVYTRYDEAWKRQFEVVFRQMKLDGDAWDAAEYFRAKLADAPAFEEALPAVEALKSRYRVAVLSNADDDFLTACLRRNKLEFDVIMTSEQAGAIKPNPVIFHKLAERMVLPAEQVLYAGDNPIPDVLGPVRAGMQAAWVNRTWARKPRNIPQPHIRVRSLTELASLLVPSFE